MLVYLKKVSLKFHVTSDTDFILRLIATDASDSDTAFKQVTVTLGGCAPGDPCGN